MVQKFKHVERIMQSNHIIASLVSMLSKQVFPFQKMMQSKQIIASLFWNSFENVSNMMGPGLDLGRVKARPVLNSLV